MTGHSRPKDGVASLAYVPGIHVLDMKKGVDGRDEPGHDGVSNYDPATGAGAARKFFTAYHSRCRFLL